MLRKKMNKERSIVIIITYKHVNVIMQRQRVNEGKNKKNKVITKWKAKGKW